MASEKQPNRDPLSYHKIPKPGKLAIVATKPMETQNDLALAYSPGVADVCMQISQNPDDTYKYTSKGNLVGIVTNGTAVLGLGDIGALASKPVMEGKAVLFKKFANVDCFDIELNEKDPKRFMEMVKALEPTFGGINLEDIKAPECFQIEQQLKSEMDIPIFHDDQHGTAIVLTAAVLNGLELINKQASAVKVVCSGAGAAGISCMEMLCRIGVKKENIFMFNTKGLIHNKRDDLNDYLEPFAQKSDTYTTLDELIEGADIFVGLSVAGVLKPEMLEKMAKNPLVFAMANPIPEIMPEAAKAIRPDVIVGTGRSDYPNQVNNVLGFPYIFRGALDVRATKINEDMKMAAAQALAALAKKPVYPELEKIYGNKKIVYGPDYLIPKPFDKRLLSHLAPKVAQAAIQSGVARTPLNISDYQAALEIQQELQ